jgi:peptidoglycan-associated lipoprotein
MPPYAPPLLPPKTLSERLSLGILDAHFDFDRSDLRNDTQAIVTISSAALNTILKEFPNASILIEGHCDERGSAEYNLALGDRRAHESKEFLTRMGVPPERLKLISYGKERPQCARSNEDCWQ